MHNSSDVSPPMAAKQPVRSLNHGDTRTDDYYWLRRREDPAVIDYLAAENNYTEEIMQHTRALQEQLYVELRGRVAEDDASVPEQVGSFHYYERNEKGRQYPIFCRKYGSLDAAEEVLLDVNDLAKGHTFTQIGAKRLSPDHHLLACALDHSGYETFTLFVKDLDSGELLADEIPGVYYGLEWGEDGQTLYYTTLDDAHRPFQLKRHRLGEDAANDEIVFQEPDETFFLGVRKSRSREFLIITLSGRTTSEVWFLRADDNNSVPKLVEPRRSGVEYSIEHHSAFFYILTNDEARDFRVMQAPVLAPGRQQWTQVIPHREDVKIEQIEVFQRHMAVHYRRDALQHLSIYDLHNGEVRGEGLDVGFDEPVYAIWTHRNPEFDSSILRFSYSSLTTPETVYDYHMDDRTRVVRKVQEVHGYESNGYVAQRLWATAPGGVPIPISVVHRKGLKLDGKNPMLIYGYGSYGVCIDPGFSPSRVSLLDRGMVFAIAHIRGGGARGRAWYEAGKLLHKKNTFSDFIACAEHVIEEGYTSSDRLAVQGRSAGGLLMGAVANMRPELFATVIAGVPFVDVLNTMLDPTIPLTVNEYEEWGNPNEPAFYEYMKSYSPYDNIAACAYPDMLVTAGLNDPRVHYWEPAKWVAKLRAFKTDDRKLLLKTILTAGHRGASGRYDHLREVAFEFAFLLDSLGVDSLKKTRNGKRASFNET